MAGYPARGSRPWDLTLKAYIDAEVGGVSDEIAGFATHADVVNTIEDPYGPLPASVSALLSNPDEEPTRTLLEMSAGRFTSRCSAGERITSFLDMGYTSGGLDILIVGDPISSSAGSWFAERVAWALMSLREDVGVTRQEWNDSTLSYDPKVTVRAASGGPTFNVLNAARVADAGIGYFNDNLEDMVTADTMVCILTFGDMLGFSTYIDFVNEMEFFANAIISYASHQVDVAFCSTPHIPGDSGVLHKDQMAGMRAFAERGGWVPRMGYIPLLEASVKYLAGGGLPLHEPAPSPYYTDAGMALIDQVFRRWIDGHRYNR